MVEREVVGKRDEGCVWDGCSFWVWGYFGYFGVIIINNGCWSVGSC